MAWLREWATDQGCWIERKALGRRELGRMEHDLYPEKELARRMWKITKGAGFGRQPYCVEDLTSGMISDWFEARPGTPLQYLDRLLLVNERIIPGNEQARGFHRAG